MRNSKASTSVSINVANPTATPVPVPTDTIPLVLTITKPINGGKAAGRVSIGVAASDNADATSIKQLPYINGALKASGSGGNLFCNLNTRKIAKGFVHDPDHGF